MTHDEMIAVIAHDKNGGVVQLRFQGEGDDKWSNGVTGSFAWNFEKFDYRIKPEPRSLWVSFNEYGKPHLSAESADQADRLARIEGRKFFLFQEVLP